MNRETFFQRLGLLLQKSRKAQRLYANMGRASNEGSPYSESQIEEWRSITSHVLSQLSRVMERPYSRNITQEVCVICENFQQTWRASEAELHKVHKELIGASERGDFVRAVMLAEQGLVLKARVQATHAAFHELNDLLKGSRMTSTPIELGDDRVVDREVTIFEKKRSYPAFDVTFDENKSAEGIERAIDQSDRESLEPVTLAKVIPLRRA